MILRLPSGVRTEQIYLLRFSHIYYPIDYCLDFLLGSGLSFERIWFSSSSISQ